MSGEALTAGGSATLQLALQVVEVHHEGIYAFAGQAIKKSVRSSPATCAAFSCEI
jgi:hypothetical protein